MMFLYNPHETCTRIKFLLSIRKVKLSKMLQDLGLGVNFIHKLNNSKMGMTSANLYEIAQYLHCSTDFLLGLSNDITIYHSSDLLTSGKMGLLSENIEQIDDTVKIG